MKFAVNEHILKVHFPPIAEVKGWLANAPPGLPLVDLCQAVPDYPPARELTDHLKECLDDPLISRYSPDEGLPEVREAVCGRYRPELRRPHRPGPDLPHHRRQPGVLARHAGPLPGGGRGGSPVPLLFRPPDGPGHARHPAVFAPFREETAGLPSLAEIERLITPRTRAILLVTPSNPTGVVTPPEIIRELAGLAARRRIALVLDETYADFIPGGARPHELFTRP